MSTPLRPRLGTTGDVLGLDLRPVTDPHSLALIGVDAVPVMVADELDDAAWSALANLRRQIACFLFRGDPLTGAMVSAAADAVNAGRFVLWPGQALPRDVLGAKRLFPTLNVPAAWGVEALRNALWRLATYRQEDADTKRLQVAAEAAGNLSELLGAEIGPPYDFGRPRPLAKELACASRRFAAAVSRAPGIMLMPLLMAADDLGTCAAGSAFEAGH